MDLFYKNNNTRDMKQFCDMQAKLGRTRMCSNGAQPTKLGTSTNNTRESCRMRYAENVRNSTAKTFVQGKPVHVNQSVNVCITAKPKYLTAPPSRIPAFANIVR